MDISIARTQAMITAVELGVDESDFRFESFSEREAWRELEAEHDARIDKDDLIWVLDVAA